MNLHATKCGQLQLVHLRVLLQGDNITLTSNVYATSRELLRQGRIAMADAVGPACFDLPHYRLKNPDINFLTDEQLWTHYVQVSAPSDMHADRCGLCPDLQTEGWCMCCLQDGQFEGRTFRWAPCPFSFVVGYSLVG